VGRLIIGGNGDMVPPPDFNWSAIGASLGASLQWAVSLGKPLMIGIATLSVVLAFSGWAAVHAGWRLYVVLAWRRRCARRRARAG
jgi:uncharacterized protein (DUF2062 family)